MLNTFFVLVLGVAMVRGVPTCGKDEIKQEVDIKRERKPKAERSAVPHRPVAAAAASSASEELPVADAAASSSAGRQLPVADADVWGSAGDGMQWAPWMEEVWSSVAK